MLQLQDPVRLGRVVVDQVRYALGGPGVALDDASEGRRRDSVRGVDWIQSQSGEGDSRRPVDAPISCQ